MVSVIEPAQKMDAIAEKKVSGIKSHLYLLRITKLTFDL